MNVPEHVRTHRKASEGVLVMSERWSSKKATQALIDHDVSTYKHLPVQRKLSSEEGFEPGFLVVGASTITFLAKDNASVVASHPLAFIESWGQDLQEEKEFNYTVKPKTLMGLVKGDNLFAFSFLFETVALVNTAVSQLDKFVLLSHTKTDTKAGDVDLVFFDPMRPEAVHATAVDHIPGERFSCEKTEQLADKSALLGGGASSEVVAIVHPRGFVLLERGEKAKGVLSLYSFNAIDSFGASSEEEFGFNLPDRLIVLRTEESGHLLNVLAMRNLKHIEEGKEPADFPLAYYP